ncbi:glycoside hydrolase family 3 C-terminal domain-containing protein [Clostridium oryzae]|uniref:Thermostable beta-glucosidase B n=1 Tax=Clostridium oryzae TaxID=1450648 RepID=A0A1V4IW23_9CLOT|nr:glycoside hydrolase family 3 C-terminal domain-containing protein [Clostridium oryzae]OPJ63995.1 thermostable beta-glucosidase B [Clostridium oryzae]
MKGHKMSSKKARIVKTSILVVLLAIVVGVNIALSNFAPVITQYFSKIDITSKEAVAARSKSTKLVNKITDEGVVLLKNDDNTLPIKKSGTGKTKVNVFGWDFTNPIYGGTGSGGVDTSTAVTPKAGLEKAGFEVNEDLYNAYASFSKTRPQVEMNGQDWTIQQPEPSKFYTADRMKKAKEFSDTAIIFISRAGGEGADLPTSMNGKDTFNPKGTQGPTGQKFGYKDDLDSNKNYFEPSNREMGMINTVTKNFKKVILVINSSNTFELGWTKNYNQIKSIVNIGGPGQNGFLSLGRILAGTVNPSGRTVDVYAKDLLDAPSAKNFGDYSYVIKNKDGSYSQAMDSKKVPLKFVNYAEGIYVGYRYYETAAAEGAIKYDDKVMYPFGYGLSYTTFDQEVVPNSLKWNDKDISVKVKVTNTGSVAGKQVVQLYYSAPYTGKIEKSSVDLAAFTKTDMIQPGKSEVVTLSFKVSDMASYDYNKVYSSTGSYVLEKGTYKLMLMNNSHEKIADVTSKALDQVVYDSQGRPTDKKVATNQFDKYVTGEGSIKNYLSRANRFANLKDITTYKTYTVGTGKTAAKVKGVLVDSNFVNYINSKRYSIPADTHKTAPTTDAKNGKKLKNYVGVDYNDKSWDKLLDQLSVKDLVALSTLGGYKTTAIKSVGKPATVDYDGPSAISAFISKSKVSGIAFPSETVIASTWNVKLAQEMGACVGAESKAYDTTGWYAPAMNIHRTAFGGRNFEYYSEDGLLSGKMAAAVTKGFQSLGGYVYMKHFALNDQETNRTFGILTWSNEQAIREIYLKSFEIEVKEGGAKAAMSSFNSIGNTWAGACSALLKSVLRDEWGFHGMIDTDFYINGKGMSAYPYMTYELGVRNGNDLYLTGVAPVGVPSANTDSKDTLWALREAAHNILYTVANSRVVKSGFAADTPTWVKLTIAIDVVAVIAIGAGLFFVLRDGKKREESLA